MVEEDSWNFGVLQDKEYINAINVSANLLGYDNFINNTRVELSVGINSNFE